MSNEMLASKVEELRSVNQSLTKELRDMKDKYDESLTLYAQAQVSLIINYSVNLFFSGECPLTKQSLQPLTTSEHAIA